MHNFAEELKGFARSLGADLVGVASVDRFEEAPKGHRPEDILPQARAVVAFAKRMPNGSLEGPATSYHHTMSVLHTQLDLIASQVALFLEREGGLAVPVPADEPYYHWEAELLYGWGDLSHKHAAQAAGLGRLGKNSLLITPEFGNRVHLVSVVTSIELSADEVIQKELCPSGCTLCIEACPAGAIGEGQQVNQRLCRETMIQKLPKGTLIESCRECRKVCKVGVRKSR
jgi:epoxyqueuosine reductase QueG